MSRQSTLNHLKIQGVAAQAFIDTPNIIYSDWSKGVDQPLGTLTKSLKICFIGAGISNAAAALELVKSGADVTVLEAEAEVGGRARSEKFIDGVTFAEMGAMRFSPSSCLLYHYAEQFGYCFVSGFPAPGQVSTLISCKGQNYEWRNIKIPPHGLEKVHSSWVKFIKEGIVKNCEQVFVSLRKLRNLLQSKDQKVRLTAVPLWQKYLDSFNHSTFHSGLQNIFGVNHLWDVPGGEIWSDEDFEKFGSLGIGCGGYRSLFDRDFTYISRLVINGLEDDQAIFAKKQQGQLFPAPIQDLVKDICAKASNLGATIKLKTFAEVLSVCKTNTGSSITVQETHQGISNAFVYNLVIVGTTTRAMNVRMGSLMSYSSNMLSKATIDSVTNISMISSTRVLARVKKFWNDENKATYPRVILSDTKAAQLYTLDCGHPEFGVVLMVYAWGEHSDQLMAVKDDKELYRLMASQVHEIMRTSEYPDYVELLTPVEENDIRVIHWQLDPYAQGAFTLAKPGQGKLISNAYFDFKSLVEDREHSGVLLNGDSISFEGGWMEGALRSAMNVTSAILLKFGSLKESNKAPVNLLDRFLYSY